ncbi:MAG: LysE family translocator [Jatrophihabitantaceae bacterium]
MSMTLVDPGLFGLFLVAAVVIFVTPGPDMMYVLANAVSMGTRGGIVAAAGMAIGMVAQTTAAALGVAALLRGDPVAYDIIRYAGGFYLGYLGIRTWLAHHGQHQPGQAERVPARKVLWRATATNLLNPKIILFYIAFLPQFVRPSLGHPTVQFLVLGVVFVILGLIADVTIAVLGGRLSAVLLNRRSTQAVINRIAATVFLGLAVRLVVT